MTNRGTDPIQLGADILGFPDCNKFASRLLEFSLFHPMTVRGIRIPGVDEPVGVNVILPLSEAPYAVLRDGKIGDWQLTAADCIPTSRRLFYYVSAESDLEQPAKLQRLFAARVGCAMAQLAIMSPQLEPGMPLDELPTFLVPHDNTPGNSFLDLYGFTRIDARMPGTDIGIAELTPQSEFIYDVLMALLRKVQRDPRLSEVVENGKAGAVESFTAYTACLPASPPGLDAAVFEKLGRILTDPAKHKLKRGLEILVLFVEHSSLEAAGTQGKAGGYKGARSHVRKLENELGVRLCISHSGISRRRNWSTSTPCAKTIAGWLNEHKLLG